MVRKGPGFPGHPYRAFLLGARSGRALYRIAFTGHITCWGAGEAAAIGKLNVIGCQDSVAGNPIPFEEHPGPVSNRGRGPARIDGVAADQVASVALRDSTGTTIATADVTDNLFAFPASYATTSARAVALDAEGKVLGLLPHVPHQPSLLPRRPGK